MRCEAINAPSTRLDLRLHRHEAYSRRATGSFSSSDAPARRLLARHRFHLAWPKAILFWPRIISIYYPACPPFSFFSILFTILRTLFFFFFFFSFFFFFFFFFFFSNPSKRERFMKTRLLPWLHAIRRGQCFIVRGRYRDCNESVSRIDMERWVNLLDSFIFERAKGKSD